MPDQQLIDYIKQCRDRGLDDEKTRELLEQSNWPKSDIEEAIKLIDSSKPPVLKTGRLPYINELISLSWDTYKQRVRTFVQILILPYLFSLAVTFVLSFLSRAELAGKGSVIGTVIFITLTVIMVSVMVYIFVWGQVSLIHSIFSDKKAGVIDIYKSSRKKVLSYIYLSFLNGIIITAGFVVFAVPGIIFALWFIPLYFVLIIENKKGMAALVRSRQLAKGYMTALAWRIAGFAGLIILLALAFGIIMRLIEQSVNSDTVTQILSLLTNLLFILFITPFAVVYTYYIYEHLKMRKSSLLELTPQQFKKQRKGFIILSAVSLIITPLVIIGLLYLGAAENVKDNNMRQLMDQLSASANTYYEKNQSYAEFNQDKEWTNIQVFIDSLNKDNQKDLKMNISEDNQDYAIIVQLNNGNYYCVDSQGFKGEISADQDVYSNVYCGNITN